MLRFRSFHNFDPPALANIWAEQSRFGVPCLEVTPGILERHVLGKIFFQREGLVVALQGSKPVGFAHAGFGPSQAGVGLDTSVGVICVVAITPAEARKEVAEGLIRLCEEYLRGSGARQIFVGGAPFVEPFWVGICPGARPPGIPEGYPVVHEILQDLGYTAVQRRRVFHVCLQKCCPPIRPEFLRIQISYVVSSMGEVELFSWWELATLASFQLEGYELRDRRSSRPVARLRILYHDSPGGWAVPRCVSVWDISEMPPSLGKEGEAFMIAQVANELTRRGVEALAIQVQVPVSQQEADSKVSVPVSQQDTDGELPYCEWLGFLPCLSGIVYSKCFS